MDKAFTVKEYLRLLEKRSLLKTVKTHYPVFINVLKECLKPKGEEVLIIGDLGYPRKEAAPLLAGCYALAAKNLNLDLKVGIQDPKKKGEKAAAHIEESLLELPPNNIIIALTSNMLGSMVEIKSFRKFTKKRKHKFLSASDLSQLSTKNFPLLVKSIDVDYKEMRKTGNTLKKIFTNAHELHITSPSGTDLYFNVKGMKAKANNGDYQKVGTGGNIPCGETYIPPRGKKVYGKVVIDGSMRTKSGTTLLKSPIKMKIEEGEVVSIKGEKARLLESTLKWAYTKAKHPWGIRRIGEFGLGFNPNADIIGPTVVNEKALGTAHVAIGSNAWFGGSIYAIIHLDQVFRNPKVFADGELICL
ncbi:hypothetical protein D6745_03700 [Candidatus Woesearchaeota archaeon]|nr:MAG: hypothetical protein D6745_03700 [Candidatus Woesearchaeota archaeon]